MKDIKYHYAKNENGEIVDISDVTEEYRKEHRFFCISCGEEMIAKMGKIKVKHFAHKVDTQNCNSETYLHKLTKLRLKEKFYSDNPFEVAYWVDIHCSKEKSCIFYKKDVCRKKELRIYDLKKYYDVCEEERREDKFIGDLKITSSTNPNLPPILIEVCVTHECTLDKKESGIKIIEVYIRDEDEILILLSNGITESKDDKCKFYGFKRDVDSHLTNERDNNIWRYSLYKSGLSYVSKNSSCSEYDRKNNHNAILEINIDNNRCVVSSIYDIGDVISLSLGYNVKTCRLCKYRKEDYDLCSNFCCLYKKYGTPKNPESKDAIKCGYYKIDNDIIEWVRGHMSDITFNIVK